MDYGNNQQITYWPPVNEGKFGQTVFGVPTIVYGRWEDRNEQVITQAGENIVSKSIVWVDRDVAVEGYLAQGDLTAVGDPRLISTAQEIRALFVTPDIRNVSVERRAVL